MADYQGKKVVIIGLGLTGLSCVDFFLARGVTPRHHLAWINCRKRLSVMLAA